MTLILKPHNKRRIWYIYAQKSTVPNSVPRVRNKNQAKSLELLLIFPNLKGNELSRVHRNRKSGHSTDYCAKLREEADVTMSGRWIWINGVGGGISEETEKLDPLEFSPMHLSTSSNLLPFPPIFTPRLQTSTLITTLSSQSLGWGKTSIRKQKKWPCSEREQNLGRAAHTRHKQNKFKKEITYK